MQDCLYYTTYSSISTGKVKAAKSAADTCRTFNPLLLSSWSKKRKENSSPPRPPFTSSMADAVTST